MKISETFGAFSPVSCLFRTKTQNFALLQQTGQLDSQYIESSRSCHFFVVNVTRLLLQYAQLAIIALGQK